MKLRSLLLFFLSPVALFAVKVGDTYDAVIAEKGVPRGRMGSSANQILNYPDMNIQLREGMVFSIKIMEAPNPTTLAPKVASKDPAEALRKEREQAIARVKAIVNQPIQGVPRNSSKNVGHFPYWFHEGAGVPDFLNDDVRATQGTDKYEKFDFVYSDLDPKTYFPGAQVEFNSQLKLFYVDRTVPKKRLTQSEMMEINRLYRIIGRCDLGLANSSLKK